MKAPIDAMIPRTVGPHAGGPRNPGQDWLLKQLQAPVTAKRLRHLSADQRARSVNVEVDRESRGLLTQS